VATATAHVQDQYRHPEFGQLTVTEVMRMIAHEVQHHAWDIQRCLNAA
jgi:hypothetical protein